MGVGDVVSEKPDSMENGNVEEKKAEVEENIEHVTGKKEEKHDGITEMEKDKTYYEQVVSQAMDVDKEEAKNGKESCEKGEDETGINKEVKEEGIEEEKEVVTDEGNEEGIEEKIEEGIEKGIEEGKGLGDEKEKEVDKVKGKEVGDEKEKEEDKVKGKEVGDEKEKEEDKVEGKEEGIEEKKVHLEKEEVIEREVKDLAKSEEDTDEKTGKGTENVIGDDDGVNDEEGKGEKPSIARVSKKRSRTKSNAGKNARNKKDLKEEEKQKVEEKELKTPKEKWTKGSKTSSDKIEEPKTPAASSFNRPVRERKSVERLVATIEKDPGKDFYIEKGRGTALKDIPNVAYKLSRKKTEDTFKLLHTILFGRRGKASQIKNNISMFSGFVWHDNEEKQLIKVKEKLDKCVKEKLVEICDVLDIPISKANTRKEDIIAKLIEFLVEPQGIASESLAEKDQSSKGKKRKRNSKPATESSTPSKGSFKNPKKPEISSKKGGEATSKQPESEDEAGEEEEEEAREEEDVNGIPEKSEDEISEQAGSEERENDSEEESDDNKGKQKPGSAKSSSKKKPIEKVVSKKTIPKKASPPPKKAPAKSPSSQSKKSSEMTSNKSSGKKKDEPVKKSLTPKKSATKESAGKKLLKAKEKIEEKIKPTDDELKNAICEILKDVDFNTATFTDILKLLAKKFHTDLAARKSNIKLMIQDELAKLADADDASDDEDEGDDDKDEKNSPAKDVTA